MNQTNSTQTNNLTYLDILYASELRRSPNYSFYYLGLARIFILGIIPLTSLIYLNWNIYHGVRHSSIISKPGVDRQQRREKELNLAKVLVVIVVVFIICHTFRVIIEIDNMIVSENATACLEANQPAFSLWSEIVDYLSETTMIINSSANMVIYCCLNELFRKLIFPCDEKLNETFNRVEAGQNRNHIESAIIDTANDIPLRNILTNK